MDRILILMAAIEYADAQPALNSARRAADHPDALSWGLALENEPDEASVAALDRPGTFFICSNEDLWREMERFWSGESYVLMAHSAMRFTRGWDTQLIRALRACPSPQALTCALTGFLPMKEDPMGEVCPVAADAFERDGSLTFQPGMPLRYYRAPARTPFLHPHFCFAPAGFFRAVAEGDEPIFLRAHRAQWQLYCLHQPLIRLLWDVPVAPVLVPPHHELERSFEEAYGVSFTARLLSAQSRRGLMSTKIEGPRRVPRRLRLREGWRKMKHDLHCRFNARARRLQPKCITCCTSSMSEEALHWLRQLAGMKNLHLGAYVDPPLKRHIAEFLPDVYDLMPHHKMELPVRYPEQLEPLSKAAILSAARDKFLSPSHYIWMDPDCIRYPLYAGSFLDWRPVCTDKVVMAMIGGQPDTSIFSVPENLVLDLASDLYARALAVLTQRGSLPSEQELWMQTIRENPGWFTFINLPMRGQLFTLVCEA